ncbi:MAG TPA: MarR family transcriptional regulator [Marmoricola sp.]
MADQDARAAEIRALERELAAMVRRIKRAIATRAHMVHPELAAASWSMLASLRDDGPQRSADLSERFSIDKGAVSRQVSTLEDLGLVGREPDPDDGRAQLLRLTEEGARRVDEVDARRREWYEGRLSDWGAAEIGDLAERLGAYNRALDSD